MFDANRIKNGFIGLVGWKKDHDPNGENLFELVNASSGMYYNGEHPLLTIDNLVSIAPDFQFYEYPLFNSSKIDYLVGDKVEEGGKYYERVSTSTIAENINNVAFWKEFTPFYEWLKERTEEGILQSINDWFSKKSKLGTARNILFVNTENDSNGDLVAKIGGFVGPEVEIKKSIALICSIDQIGLCFTEAQTIDLVIEKEGEDDRNLSFEYDDANKIQWFEVDETLKKGKYKIKYDDSLISGSAINGDVLKSSTFMNVVSASSYGIYFKMSIMCDYTDFILEHKNAFKSVIAKRTAINLLREMVYNPSANVNRNERNIDAKQLLYEIDGDSQATEGNNRSLREQYDQAMNAVMIDRSGIDKICLPCRARGVRYGTV